MRTTGKWTIYHNPECSKSRAALKYLEGKGVEPRIVEYLETPLDATTLNDLLRKLGLGPRDVLRDGEDEYEQLGLANASLSSDDIVNAIVAHPILLQRPLIVRDERAVIGRPTEAIDDLFDA